MTIDRPNRENSPPPEIQSEKPACVAPSIVVNSIVSRDELIPTRASLLERLKDLGNEASWNEFYQVYRELIYGVARRAGLSEVESEEVVQETLISVARKMPGFRYDPVVDSFKGWLLTVTRWRILDQFKKQQTLRRTAWPTSAAPKEEETRTSPIERIPDPAGFDLNTIWDEEWAKHLLHSALARIKRQVHPQQYEIYHLHVILDNPVREVARTLGVNVGQVYLARHRVGSMLKKEMKRLAQGH